ncbi:hypothetical protein J2S43_004477 [Catenuloplanes nepalensis]|uniref:SGNH hydrolase-type esterase domain-containing protein n=1 Tax=Catenuloplanes nepalensis TaxID=587533 RepID=A0ABT9MWZ5_9ACTN|nr:GDSL-type esterase/lipase family protein [Catenuloplanes nepalensis]MDP9795965.1 hypothetical protein [Catenuloplanes nepalensis]
MIDVDLLRGALEIERTPHGLLPHRLPRWARDQAAEPQLAMVEAEPSGVRLALRTAATWIELDTLPSRVNYAGAPARPAGAYDLLIDGSLVARAVADGGDTVSIDMATGARTVTAGPAATLRFDGLPAGEKDVEIWLPYRERTELRDLRADAPIAPMPDRGRRVWVHHGSSISHGSNTDGPSTTWPALAALAGGVELVNLGFGGSALLDPFTARVIRDAPADLISVKIGINVVNADLMRRRAFGPAVHGFLDTIRDGHPDVPLLVVSPILCPIHEDTPGPGAFDLDALAEGRLAFRATGDPAEVAAGKLTLRVIRDELARITASRDDPHLHHLNGLELYGEADAEELPLPDALHPDAATHRLIGSRFAERVFGPGGAFSRA